MPYKLLDRIDYQRNGYRTLYSLLSMHWLQCAISNIWDATPGNYSLHWNHYNHTSLLADVIKETCSKSRIRTAGSFVVQLEILRKWFIFTVLCTRLFAKAIASLSGPALPSNLFVWDYIALQFLDWFDNSHQTHTHWLASVGVRTARQVAVALD